MSIDAPFPLPPGKDSFRVGAWTVEAALNQLSLEGRTVKVEPKAMQVLCCLAAQPGQVVSREALLSAAWPGVIVGDDALTQVVVKLRKALGDAPDAPAYIQTISKGGYRLVAPVTGLDGSPAPKTPANSGSPREGNPRAPRLTIAAGVASLLVVVAMWWVVGERAPLSPPERAPVPGSHTARATQPAIAIMPFEAIGNDPNEALLARGIAADLVTDLSKVPGLWVVRTGPTGGRTDSGHASDAPRARYLVSGTVQRMGERMRLHVHLSDAETGKHLWSERFDRAWSGLFDVQEELGPKILHLLPVKVSEAEKRRVAQRYTRNMEAYEVFQRGQAALHVRRRAENEAARELFRRAIGLDAAFARAYAGLAMTYTADYRNHWVDDGVTALDRAFELARTAHQIDPDTPETYWLLAFVHVHRHQQDEALKYLETVLRLYPSFADGYAMMGGIYTSIGRPAEGVPLLRTAMRLLPESGYLYYMLLGRAYLFLGDLEQAQVNLEHALSRNPEFLDARVYLAAAHVAAGNKTAAAWEAEEIRALEPGFTVRRWLETNPTTDAALRTKIVGALGELGL
jgi:TolB-like protein/DNA-binding winged helix-turn-helix (wHTH) protein